MHAEIFIEPGVRYRVRYVNDTPAPDGGAFLINHRQKSVRVDRRMLSHRFECHLLRDLAHRVAGERAAMVKVKGGKR